MREVTAVYAKVPWRACRYCALKLAITRSFSSQPPFAVRGGDVHHVDYRHDRDTHRLPQTAGEGGDGNAWW